MNMIPALGHQTTIFQQLRYPGLGNLATCGEKKHRAEECANCAAAREHDKQALRPLRDAMQTIVTEFSASPADDARDLINAAQVMLTGERQDVRNLCKPWGAHLAAQKSIAP